MGLLRVSGLTFETRRGKNIQGVTMGPRSLLFCFFVSLFRDGNCFLSCLVQG